MKKEFFWLALVDVEAINGNLDLGDADGAFVNVAYKAKSKIEFLSLVRESFVQYDFEVIEIDDIEQYPNIDIENTENAEKLELISRLKSDEELQYCWGIFHTYDN